MLQAELKLSALICAPKLFLPKLSTFLALLPFFLYSETERK